MKDKSLKIYAKKENSLTKILNEHYEIRRVELLSTLHKLFFATQEYPDIYFHSGAIDKTAKEMIKRSKKIIVNSFRQKQKIVSDSLANEQKIEVIYPDVQVKKFKAKKVKKALLKELGVDDREKKIILFSANNFKTGGFTEFLDILDRLNNDFLAIAVGSDDDIYKANFILDKYTDIKEKVKLIKKTEHKDTDLFQAADIYIAPTYGTAFATNVLKAMASKCAVFVTVNNDAVEAVDVFAVLQSPTSPAASFKIDALLGQKVDLKVIKKQNFEAMEEFTMEKHFEKFREIVESMDGV